MSMIRNAALAAVLLGSTALATPSAEAATILAFGQATAGSPVTAVRTGSSTTISATNALVTVTEIAGGLATPFNAFLNFSVTNTNGATSFSGQIAQNYAGDFSISSGLNGTGTNFLSSDFISFVFGGGSSATLQASEPPGTVSFTSDVIAAGDLGEPRAFSFSFANISPQLAIVNGTLRSFTASVSGTASAEAVPVPEPASLALLGAGLLGLGLARRRRAI